MIHKRTHFCHFLTQKQGMKMVIHQTKSKSLHVRSGSCSDRKNSVKDNSVLITVKQIKAMHGFLIDVIYHTTIEFPSLLHTFN